jgi:hypothetical protein
VFLDLLTKSSSAKDGTCFLDGRIDGEVAIGRHDDGSPAGIVARAHSSSPSV